tara:strand:+ start:43 stop:501 length:459 start_codon:yes stop_codon:yes gene_type:complete
MKPLIENNYSISYPDDWELDQSELMGSNFILFSPFTSTEDLFKENVNLIIQDLTGHNVDLDQYIELSGNQIKTYITAAKFLENKKITTGGLNYQKLVYTGKQGVYNLKFEQYIWVIEDTAFVLTLTCEEDQFDHYKTIGEKILNSFVIDKAK